MEQGPIIQQFLYALILGTFELDYKIILIFQSFLTIFVVLITFQFVKKKTNVNIALFALFPFLLFPVFYFGNYTLKQYPLFLFLLILSLYYFDKYLTNKEDKTLFLSALFLSLSTMTHLLVLPFIGFVFLYYFWSRISKNKNDNLIFKNVLKFYFIFLLILSPFLIWRLANAPSLEAVLTYPSAWGTMKYGRIVNEQFWGFSSPFTFEYFHDLYELLVNWIFIPILLPFLIYGLSKYKDKKFIIIWFFMLLAPYLVGRGVIAGVYTYPFVPLMVILSAVGLNELLKLRINRKVIVLIISIIIIFCSISYSVTYSAFEQEMKLLSQAVEDASEFNQIIPEGNNILFRSRSLSNYLPYKNILQIGKDLAEEDAVTYLNWTSDEKVSEVFRKYNISYVILCKNIRFERDYHVWFKIIMGNEPRHYYMIKESPYFRKVNEGRQFILYEFLR